MNILSEHKNLPLKQMEKYISEWFFKYKTSVFPSADNRKNIVYNIIDLSENKVVYTHTFNSDDYSENAKVSTEGIINEEFRGLIEQCIDLDIQLENSKNSTTVQKGE